MVMILKPYGLAYFPIPKVANTSVKAAIAGALPEADVFDTGNKRMSARLREMTKDMRRIAIVRDPVERALSGWANRVIHQRDIERSPISRPLLKRLGLSTMPDADTFFLNLRTYMLTNNRVRRHLLPQVAYIGDDLSYFDKVYVVDNLDPLADDLSALIGQPIMFGRLQTGGPKVQFSDLTPAAATALLQHLEPDYRLLAGYFSPKPLPKDSKRPAA